MIAIRTRSNKTMLVEGRDDKELFERLKLESEENNVTIDTSSIFDDRSLATLGAKARIDYFLERISDDAAIGKKIRCFVDREWEGLIDPENSEPIPWRQPNITANRLTTWGHSIENYGFSADFVKHYLSHFGHGVASGQVLAAVLPAVPELLRAGAAFSEVARKRNILTRCSSIFDIEDFGWVNQRLVIRSSVLPKLLGRGCPDPDGMLTEFNQLYSGRWAQAPLSEEAHLHAHGHLGETILWVGIGRLVINQGVPEHLGREIALGRKDEKRRVWYGWLSALEKEEVRPLHMALQ